MPQVHSFSVCTSERSSTPQRRIGSSFLALLPSTVGNSILSGWFRRTRPAWTCSTRNWPIR